MPRRVSFTIKFTTDLDNVPGWGYHVSGWIKLATADSAETLQHHVRSYRR